MDAAIVKVQKNKNITLPTWLIRLFHVGVGDFIRIEKTKNGVLLKPAKLVDPSQAYFWTKEWQEGEREVEEQIRKGHVQKAKTVDDLIKDLNA